MAGVGRLSTFHVEPSGTVIPVPPGGRLVVVADTHSRPHPALARRLEELRPVAILHAGDVGDAAVLDTLAACAPVVAVRGNIDGYALPDARVVDLRFAEGALRVFLTHVALYGPRIRAEVARAARASGAGLVVCGHSHVPFLGRDRGIVVFNPGSVGPKRFTLPILYGTIEMGEEGVRLRHWEVETGRGWEP